MHTLGPATALVLIDVQNDFFHEKGAAWKRDQHEAALADLASVATIRTCEEAITPR